MLRYTYSVSSVPFYVRRPVIGVLYLYLLRSQRVRADGKLSVGFRVNSGVRQVNELSPLLFLAYVNDIWRNMESNIRLFADDCIIYRNIMDDSFIHKLQTGINRLVEWTLENELKINQGKSKTVSFKKARVKKRIRYYFGGQLITEISSFNYLGIIISSDLNCADHVNHTLRKAWKALHFIMRILKREIITRGF